MKRTKKRVVIISDLHSGTGCGLTPPDWQYKYVMNDRTKRNKFSAIQKQCWEFYYKTIMQLKPIDILIVNGDAIDGHGERSGGTEQITTDMQVQAEMASECINITSADKKIIIAGTAYHTGQVEDFETLIKDYTKADKFGSHEWIDINGIIFDCKHHLGSSGVPYARHTAISKENVWNALWAERKEQPRGDIFIRSHTHSFSYAGNGQFLGIVTPALMGLGSRYGSRRCTGTVDFGLISFDIDSDGRYTWNAHLADIVAQRASVIKL